MFWELDGGIGRVEGLMGCVSFVVCGCEICWDIVVMVVPNGCSMM